MGIRWARAGKVNTLWAMLLVAGVAIVVLVGLLRLPAVLHRPSGGGAVGDGGGARLAMYCAAGLRVAMEEIVRRYQRE